MERLKAKGNPILICFFRKKSHFIGRRPLMFSTAMRCEGANFFLIAHATWIVENTSVFSSLYNLAPSLKIQFPGLPVWKRVCTSL